MFDLNSAAEQIIHVEMFSGIRTAESAFFCQHDFKNILPGRFGDSGFIKNRLSNFTALFFPFPVQTYCFFPFFVGGFQVPGKFDPDLVRFPVSTNNGIDYTAQLCQYPVDYGIA